jgi:hypothetical protein
MPALQPTHENAGQARVTPIGVSFAPQDVATVGQVGWVGLGQQLDERT